MRGGADLIGCFPTGRHYPGIAHLLREMTCRLTPAQAKEIAAASRTTTYTASELDELRGTAHGAGVLEENLAALQLAAPILGWLPSGSHRHDVSLAGIALTMPYLERSLMGSLSSAGSHSTIVKTSCCWSQKPGM